MRVAWPLVILRPEFVSQACVLQPSSWELLGSDLRDAFAQCTCPDPRSQLAYFSASIDVIVPENGEPVGTREIKCCIRQIQELIISRLNQAVANKLISSVDYLRESFVGTLERCLQSLEKSQDVSVHITSNNLKQVLTECLRHHVTDNA